MIKNVFETEKRIFNQNDLFVCVLLLLFDLQNVLSSNKKTLKAIYHIVKFSSLVSFLKQILSSFWSYLI